MTATETATIATVEAATITRFILVWSCRQCNPDDDTLLARNHHLPT
jgi:hypothetical protein